MADTPQRTKLIDAFLGFLVVVGGLQFVYCVIAGNYVSGLFSFERVGLGGGDGWVVLREVERKRRRVLWLRRRRNCAMGWGGLRK